MMDDGSQAEDGCGGEVGREEVDLRFCDLKKPTHREKVLCKCSDRLSRVDRVNFRFVCAAIVWRGVKCTDQGLEDGMNAASPSFSAITSPPLRQAESQSALGTADENVSLPAHGRSVTFRPLSEDPEHFSEVPNLIFERFGGGQHSSFWEITPSRLGRQALLDCNHIVSSCSGRKAPSRSSDLFGKATSS